MPTSSADDYNIMVEIRRSENNKIYIYYIKTIKDVNFQII